MGAPQYEQAGADIGGTGTTNTIPRWTGPSTLGDSGLIDNGTAIYTTARDRFGIGIATPDQGLHVLSPNNATTSGGQVTQQNFNGVSNQKWMTSVGGGDNAWVNGRGWFLRDMTAGATRIVCDTSGNVGIGTASPTSFGAGYTGLSINGTTTGVFEIMQGGSGALRMFSNATTVQVEGLGARSMICSTGGIARLRISSAGAEAASQVAIGTSSFTTGRALTTVADLDVFGVRVGRGAGDDANSVAIGVSALASQTAGFRGNVAIGFQSCRSNTSAQANVGVGYYALDANQTGQDNVAVGSVALAFINGTSGNVAVGMEAGRRVSAGTNMTAATDSIFIGRDSRANAASETNQIVIGTSAVGNGSNTATLGNASTVSIHLDAKFVRLVDSYTVGTLPVAGTAGRIARVTDGDAGLAWGATVVNTGAGATPYLVWDNGTNWTVFGK